MRESTRTSYLKLSVAAATALFALASSAPASAQASRTWVSATGSDTNACIRTAPCLTFSGALAKTSAGGEINCLTAGDYGAVTITKAIIIACGNIGGITVTSGTAITVSAGSSDTVVLEGMELVGGNGILFNSGAQLVLQEVTVRNTVYALTFAPSADASLTIDHSTFNNNFAGIDLFPSSAAAVRATVSHSRVSGGSYAVIADAQSTSGAMFMAVRSTTLAGAAKAGVYVRVGSGPNATVALDDVMVAGGRGAALDISGTRAGALVSDTIITGNQDGGLKIASGGVAYSYGNNRVNGNNGKDGAFTGILSQR